MTDTNQLPPLQPGDSHAESLIEAAIQGHASTREAMRWLVRQIVPPQALAHVHPAQAEVTDDVSLDERFRDWIVTIKDAHDNSLDGEHASSRSMLRGVISEMEEAHAILALSPAAVPMTDEHVVVPLKPTEEMIRYAEMWDDGFEGAYARALAALTTPQPAQAKKETP